MPLLDTLETLRIVRGTNIVSYRAKRAKKSQLPVDTLRKNLDSTAF